MQAKPAAGKRDNGADFAMGAINEAFADLIAYYALDTDEGKLSSVVCFAKNREISSPAFGSNSLKVFDRDALESINDPKARKADRDCNTPNHQEIHDVGAIFAYGINYLVSKTADLKQEKLGVVLEWSKELASEYESLKSLEAGEVLFASMELAFKTALAKAGVRESSAHCQMMDELFTGSHDYKCRYLK